MKQALGIKTKSNEKKNVNETIKILREKLYF